MAGCGDNSNSVVCGNGTTEQNGICVADNGGGNSCGTGTVAMGTECVPDGSVICETGTMFDMATGTCVADITGCASGTIIVDGVCKDPADVTADVEEPAEPNDFFLGGTPGQFELPAVGESITFSGCIEPTVVDGVDVADLDSYFFTSAGSALLEITVDGFGGAAGAFRLRAADDELDASGYERFGLNLANDTSSRQVFLPKGADYGIFFGDSRTFLPSAEGPFVAGPAAGGPGACYLATIRNVAIPAATAVTAGTALAGSLNGDAQFLSFTAVADGSIAGSTTSAPSGAVLVDTVLMVNDTYAGSQGRGQRVNGSSVTKNKGGLNIADDIVYVVDPVVNFALNPVDFSHLIAAPSVVALPTDGSTVSVANPGASNLPTLESYLSFEVANDGDVVFLDLDVTSLSTDLDWTIVNENFVEAERVVIAGFSAGEEVGHYQFEQAGTYYIDIRDFSGDAVDPYDIVATQIDHTPTPIVVGTPLLAQVFGADNAEFYTITPNVFEWWNVQGTPTGFNDDMLLEIFGTQTGRLGQTVNANTSVVLVDGEDNIQFLENASPALLQITDDSTNPGAGSAFDLSISDVPFVDLGLVADGAPVNSVVTNSAANVFYLAQASNGEVVNITITGNNGFDPVLVLIDSDGETVLDANIGADSNEKNFRTVVNGRVAFAVRAAAGGDYTIDLSIATLLNLTSAPAAAISDTLPPTVDTIDNADPCTISALNVDVDISHTFIGDLDIVLTSPAGTEVVLHNRSGGGNDDIIGNYNASLTSDEDLGAFVGGEGMGTWTMTITDNAGGDDGTLNSWGVNLVCE